MEIVEKSIPATSLFQSVLYVTHSRIKVCKKVPPIIPDHIPYKTTNFKKKKKKRKWVRVNFGQ